MIKQLFLTAALLMPGLANAGTPSATLPGQIVPAEQGPAVPAPAAAAGFTTLAANYDFSQPQYATQSNWLDCSNTNSALTWHVGPPYNTPSQLAPCNFNQATDPVTAQTVLAVTWLNSYGTPTRPALIMCTCFDSTHYTDFPNFYVETVIRMNHASAPFGQPFGQGAVWNGQDANGVYNNTNIELDYVELSAGAGGIGDAAVHNWGNLGAANGFTWSTAPSGVSGWGVTSYHKYGMLFTSDGATASYACSFVDDINQGCMSAATLSSLNQYLWRNYLFVSNGSNGGVAPDTTMYVQYIRVYSCTNWALPAGQPSTAAHMCNGSTLFQGAQNGHSLTYWH